MSGTAGPGLVAVIAYDGLCTFEFGIAVEVFGLPRPEFDFTWYDFRVVSADGSRLRAVGGIFVEAAPDLSILKRARTIVVPGWRNRGERPLDHLLEAIPAHPKEARGACRSVQARSSWLRPDFSTADVQPRIGGMCPISSECIPTFRWRKTFSTWTKGMLSPRPEVRPESTHAFTWCAVTSGARSPTAWRAA